MAKFVVRGPCVVSTTKLKVGRTIAREDIAKFWADNPQVAKERGCYIFAFRAAKGGKPVYIGKATKSFKQEVFTDHKLKKYGVGLGNQVRGTPIVYFVTLCRTKGPVNKTAIDEVETFLIQSGLVANKDLLNDRKTAVESWSIGGMVRSKGKPSAPASGLKSLLKL